MPSLPSLEASYADHRTAFLRGAYAKDKIALARPSEKAHRNCNTFSDELAFRLTGRRIPSWISACSVLAKLAISVLTAKQTEPAKSLSPSLASFLQDGSILPSRPTLKRPSLRASYPYLPVCKTITTTSPPR